MLKVFLNAEVEAVTVYKEKILTGFLPLVYRQDEKYGAVCNSLPFYGSNGGIIISNTDDKNPIRELILKEFNSQVESKNCIASTVISNPLDAEGDSWMKQNIKHDLLDERIGQITHFPDKGTANLEEVLLKAFEDPRPRNIRKAQKENVKVYVSNTKEAMEFLYQTHFQNITAINGIAKEKRFFDGIPDFFNDNEYKIYIAEQNGVKIAALLLFYFNNTVEYFTPAVVETHRNLQPTALIIYQAMLDAINDGYKNWNWGGTWLSQGGVYDFKKKWGTTDYRYFYYTNVRDEKVYRLPKEILLKNYQYFFVLPFSALKNEEN
jgi:lipid II:glycine glycyltransferase (peptidoglycan interpeptide bridge formation enzyme)